MHTYTEKKILHARAHTRIIKEHLIVHHTTTYTQMVVFDHQAIQTVEVLVHLIPDSRPGTRTQTWQDTGSD